MPDDTLLVGHTPKITYVHVICSKHPRTPCHLSTCHLLDGPPNVFDVCSEKKIWAHIKDIGRSIEQMTCALASLRFASVCGRNPKCKKTNENERQITFNCVSLLVCFHTFEMCFFLLLCVRVAFQYVFMRGCFSSVIFMCVQFLLATSICADDMCSRLFARNPHM